MDQPKIAAQNLIRQVNVESQTTQPSFYKALLFDVLTIIAAAAVGYFYAQYLDGLSDIINLLIAAAVFAVFSTLEIFFTKDPWHYFLLTLGETAVILGFFYKSDFRLLTIAAGAFLFFIVYGGMLSRSELEGGLEIKFFKIAEPSLKKFTTGIILTLVIIYLPQADQNKLFVSKETFAGFVGWVGNSINVAYPEINLNSSFGELAQGVAQLQLRNNANYVGLPEDAKKDFLKQTADELIAGLNKSLGVTISSNDKTSAVLYDFIVGILNKWKGKFQNWFLVIWALLVFLVIRSLGTIFHWIVGILAFVLYQILLSFGFVHIVGESRTHEVIEY